MGGFIIYLIGYIFAYMQHRKNDRILDSRNPRTNKDVANTLLLSLFSWAWFLFAWIIYLSQSKDVKEWLKKESKYSS